AIKLDTRRDIADDVGDARSAVGSYHAAIPFSRRLVTARSSRPARGASEVAVETYTEVGTRCTSCLERGAHDRCRGAPRTPRIPMRQGTATWTTARRRRASLPHP